MNVFSCYWKAVSSPLAILVLFSVVFMQITRNLSDAWLAHWVTDSTLDGNTNDTANDTNPMLHVVQPLSVFSNDSNNTAAHTTGYYLGIYASLTITNSLVTMARSFLFAYAGLKAAKFIHNKLLNKVMYVSNPISK